jgi:hypothetical protein
MAKLPVLKPREVCRVLESLGFHWCGSEARICSIGTRMDGEQQFRIIRAGIFLLFCFARSLVTLGSRQKNSSATDEEAWAERDRGVNGGGIHLKVGHQSVPLLGSASRRYPRSADFQSALRVRKSRRAGQKALRRKPVKSRRSGPLIGARCFWTVCV